MICTQNKLVAVEPIVEVAATTKRVGGLMVLDQKVSLVESKVVFGVDGEPELLPGKTVWINGDSISKHDFVKKIYNIDGYNFILVPREFILLSGWKNNNS